MDRTLHWYQPHSSALNSSAIASDHECHCPDRFTFTSREESHCKPDLPLPSNFAYMATFLFNGT